MWSRGRKNVERSMRFYSCCGKRFLDVGLSAVALLVLAPLLAIVALVVYLKLGAPILFRQPRPGLRGKLFTLYKFRTMTDVYDAQGNLLSDAERLTRLGRFLRSMSLDELPELFNVLKGEMSLVGPRPLRVIPRSKCAATKLNPVLRAGRK